MIATPRIVLIVLFASSVINAAHAAVVADSLLDFSGTQGQDAWFYGFFNFTDHNGAYAAADFRQFERFDSVRQAWVANDAQIGRNNNGFLTINQQGGHPAGVGPAPQTKSIWAVRRYISEIAGSVSISFDLHKINISNPSGGGTTGHIFVDGVEIFQALIGNTDSLGRQGPIVHVVSVGSLIDFAIDPHGATPLVGTDGLNSARADSTYFSATISPAMVPVPGSLVLLLSAVPSVAALRRRRSAHC